MFAFTFEWQSDLELFQQNQNPQYDHGIELVVTKDFLWKRVQSRVSLNVKNSGSSVACKI